MKSEELSTNAGTSFFSVGLVGWPAGFSLLSTAMRVMNTSGCLTNPPFSIVVVVVDMVKFVWELFSC